MAFIHLCLAKKENTWLVRNSRTVMHEPYVRGLETGMVQERLMDDLDCRRVVLPQLFAYGRQLSCQMMVVRCRWLLARWVVRYGTVWSDYSDEV